MEVWFQLPWPVRVAINVAAWIGYAYVVLSLQTPESAGRIAMSVAITCMVAVALTAGMDLRTQSKYRSIDRLKVYRRALRTGEVPADTDLDEWWRWLSDSRLWNVAAVVLAGPFVLFGLMSSVYSQSPYRLVSASAFGLLGVWGFIALCIRGAQTKRLTAEVKRRQDSSDRAAGKPPTERAAFEMSLPGRLILGAFVWFIGAFLVWLVADLESLVFSGPRVLPIEWAVGTAALMALAWTVLGDVRDLRRNFASFEQHSEYWRTWRTEELPADVDPAVWRRRLKTYRRANLLRLLVAAFLVAVGVASILTDRSAYHWVTASLFQLVAIWFLVKWWDTNQSLKSLAAKVERRAIRQTWG
jgi:hypothetical protein